MPASARARAAPPGADSVPLDARPRGACAARTVGVKAALVLFLMFIVVVSDVFTDSVIAGFGEKAVQGRAPTSWGVVLQGVFLVVGYAIVMYLAEAGVL